jgi:hypothetical protein
VNSALSDESIRPFFYASVAPLNRNASMIRLALEATVKSVTD